MNLLVTTWEWNFVGRCFSRSTGRYPDSLDVISNRGRREWFPNPRSPFLSGVELSTKLPHRKIYEDIWPNSRYIRAMIFPPFKGAVLRAGDRTIEVRSPCVRLCYSNTSIAKWSERRHRRFLINSFSGMTNPNHGHTSYVTLNSHHCAHLTV